MGEHCITKMTHVSVTLVIIGLGNGLSPVPWQDQNFSEILIQYKFFHENAFGSVV